MKKKFSWIYLIAVIFLLIWSLGPILWSVVMSVTSQREMFSSSTILPQQPTLSNYQQLLSKDSKPGIAFIRGMKNSFTTSMFTIIVVLPIAVFSAYAFSRMKFKGKEVVRVGLLITFVVPVFATIISLYQMFGTWGLLDKTEGLIIIYASAFFPLIVWMLSNYFDTIPHEIEEAAWLDGCTKLQTLFKVILPLSYPVLFAAALTIFLNTWNQFLIPLIMAPVPASKPLTVVITEFVTKNTTEYGLITAGGLLALIPPAVIAILFRKYIANGVVAGAVKG
jgi:multiple sugar transport system permease protein